MQPGAHYTSAIEILSSVLSGEPAEKALLSWSRASRFAGSKDRAAVRDIVFDCLRRRASFATRFGETPRGLALGRARDQEEIAVFSGQGYAPAPLSKSEIHDSQKKVEYDKLAHELDFPEFLQDRLIDEYGDELASLMNAMRERAPVDLRVNFLKSNRDKAQDFLARDHIFTEQLPFYAALRVTLNPRRLAQSRAFSYGYVELQDVSSQEVAAFAQVQADMEVLDYCAGGGGKTLALGMMLKNTGRLDAWDISPARMKALPERAARAGLQVNILDAPKNNRYDLVFADAPCSGSGAWRRTPDAKWRLTQSRLDTLISSQKEVLFKASNHVDAGGIFVYATCSILRQENEAQSRWFCDQFKDFELQSELKLNPIINGGDGFYAARFLRQK